VLVRRSIRHAVVIPGWKSCPKPARAVALSNSPSIWMPCDQSVKKYGLSCWPKAKSIQLIRFCGQFPVNHNHDRKNLFKGAAIQVSTSPDPFGRFLPGFAGERQEATEGTVHLRS
jgi:hypothetical protein